MGFSRNPIPVADVATVYAQNPVPAGAALGPVDWVSSDPSTVRIAALRDNDADLEGVKSGTVTITATDRATGVQSSAQFTVS